MAKAIYDKHHNKGFEEGDLSPVQNRLLIGGTLEIFLTVVCYQGLGLERVI